MENAFIERVKGMPPLTGTTITVPEPDQTFFYAATRALTFYPLVNGNGASWLESDFEDFVGTDRGFKFGLANLSHSMVTTNPQVIGVIRDEKGVPNSGIDILAQIDRRACEAYGIEPSDFIKDGCLSKASVEILCDRDKSRFVAFTNPNSSKLEDQTVFSAAEAEAAGVMRTRYADAAPYFYEERYPVAELCYPLRCRGIAFLDDPADRTAQVFEVAARMEKPKHSEPYGDVDYADPGFRGKKRYRVDSRAHVLAAASYFGVAKNREEYTPEQRGHIDRVILAAKKKFGIDDDESSAFADTDTPSIDTSPDGGTDDSWTGDALDSYTDTDAMDVQEAQDLPDDAFTESYFDPYEVDESRSYPLFASKKDYLDDKPHPGLVKAALQAYKGGNFRDRKSALQRLKAAHNKLRAGDSKMTDAEKAAQEKAALETRVTQAETEVAALKDATTAKDAEIAELKTKLEAADTENASLKQTIEAKQADELASVRLEKLLAIDGFEVKDEEKAALLNDLKSEDELQFQIRTLSTENAALKKSKSAGGTAKTEEEQASLEAAALAGLSDTPQFTNAKGEKVDKYSIM